MSCQAEPQHGGEGIVAVCGLLELIIIIIIITIIIIIMIMIIIDIWVFI